MLAKELMEDLFQQGIYQESKRVEKNLEMIKAQTIQIVSQSGFKDERRLERNDVVIKWVNKPVYETDQLGLMNFLDDLGLLPYCSKISKPKKEETEKQKFLDPYKECNGYRVQFYPKKKLAGTEADIQLSEDLDELSTKFILQDHRSDELEKMIQKVQRKMLMDPTFIDKVQTDFGSASKFEKTSTYNTEALYNDWGLDVFLQYTSISMEHVTYFMQRGFLQKSDISQFRKIVDIQGFYMVMNMAKENKVMEMLNDKRVKAYLERVAS